MFFLIPMLLIALVYGAMWWVTFNHTDRLGQAIFVLPNGNIDKAVLGAAVGAKFPNGTKESAVRQFATELRGTCSIGPPEFAPYCGGEPNSRPPQCATQIDDTLYCRIPVTGTFCIADGIIVKAHLEQGGIVSNVSGRWYSVAC